MISMTGFGKASLKNKDAKCTVEISSVNHKYFIVNFKMHGSLLVFQDKIRKLLNDSITRGSVEINIFMEDFGSRKKILLNEHIAEEYMHALNKLKNRLNLKGPVTISQILKFDNIFNVTDERVVDWNIIKGAIEKALKCYLLSKTKEGRKMRADIQTRLRSIGKSVASVEKLYSESAAVNRQRLETKFRSLFTDTKLDENRMYAEISYMLERNDITEEITRLKCHIGEFGSIMSAGNNCGRKLDFLVQEMMREINTIGSKANNALISHIVVNFKEEIEKIREQVQNVE
jgi:uncharacterized protein (TIGR00255 family)